MNLKERRQQEKILKIGRKKEDPSQVLNDALAIYRSENLKLALKICQSVLAVHPKHPDALILGGSIYLDLGQSKQSVKYLKSVVEILPDSPQAHFNLGTVLDRMGHQAAHMHRNAWISGVYYVQLPDVMHGDNKSRSGWIEFGRPPDEFPRTVEHEARTFEPREGRMFMFPSFEYHRTIPFESSEQRISIAFDLLA